MGFNVINAQCVSGHPAHEVEWTLSVSGFNLRPPALAGSWDTVTLCHKVSPSLFISFFAWSFLSPLCHCMEAAGLCSLRHVVLILCIALDLSREHLLGLLYQYHCVCF